MAYIFNVVYLVALVLASPWLACMALRHGKYRHGYAEKLLGRVPKRVGGKPCAWFHAVSVGEVNLLSGVLKEFRAQRPGWDCVISTTTAAGYELARQKYAGTPVCYCPLDFSWSVAEAFARIRPSLLILAELEIWPNLIRAANQRQVPVAVINGRLSAKSFARYRLLGRFAASIFGRLDLVAAQTAEYAERFSILGVRESALVVSGNLKFDNAQTNRRNAKTQALAQLADIDPAEVVFLAGSTQDPEERLALAAFQSLANDFPLLRLVLVPRHPERFAAVAEMLAASGVAWQRRSELEPPSIAMHQPAAQSSFVAADGAVACDADGDGAGEGDDPGIHPARATPVAGGEGRHPRVLLVDTVGELGAWWGTAHIAFVGGSLGRRGGQNMLEPSAYGAAVSFGPNTQNFRDIVQALLSDEAAEVVRDGAELTAFVRRCLTEPEYAQTLGERAQALVKSGQGATKRTLARLLTLVEAAPQYRRQAA